MVTNYNTLFGDLHLPASSPLQKAPEYYGTVLEDSGEEEGGSGSTFSFVPVLSSHYQEVSVTLSPKPPDDIPPEWNPAPPEIPAVAPPSGPGVSFAEIKEEDRALSSPRRQLIMRTSKRHNNYLQRENPEDSASETPTADGSQPAAAPPVTTPEKSAGRAAIPPSWPPRGSAFRAGGAISRTGAAESRSGEQSELETEDAEEKGARSFPPARQSKAAIGGVRNS
jgi:hypothetical protein